jgi:hypothetical protein
MPTTIQRLSDSNSLQRFSSADYNEIPLDEIDPDWEIIGTNGSISYTFDNFFVYNRYILEIQPSTLGVVTISLPLNFFNSYDTDSFFGFNAIAFCGLSPINVQIVIHDTSILATNSISATDGITYNNYPGKWTPLRSLSTKINALGGAHAWRVTLKISNHDGNVIRITNPNLLNDTAWASNSAVRTMRKYMPEFYFDKDGLEENPNYPMFRFAEVLSSKMHDVMQVYSNWFRYEVTEFPPNASTTDTWTRSSLVDSSAIDEQYMYWLFQFTGRPLQKQIYTDGDAQIVDVRSFAEWQLSTSSYGRGAGTKQALVGAIQQVLTGSKRVALTPNKDGNPWVIGVTTITSETPDDAVVLAVAENARPLGYVLDTRTVAALTLILGNITYARLGYAVL